MADPTKIAHPSVDERRVRGKAQREQTPLSSHAGWKPAADRPDPVALLEEQNTRREPDLVPVRHGRMMVSPFTFYRGAARIMAADLKDTPRAGLTVQLCGDAHLSNFGVFASPERTLLFDLNDFDETLPGPFEYDVKRMAASFTDRGAQQRLQQGRRRGGDARGSVSAYHQAMAEFATMGVMDIWYARITEADLMAVVESSERCSQGQGAEEDRRGRRQERRRRPLRRPTPGTACRRSTSSPSRSTAPTASSASRRSSSRRARCCRIYGFSGDELQHVIHEQFRAYRATLQHDRRRLLEQFEVVDMARKVVGVGSVGTRCVHRAAAGARPAAIRCSCRSRRRRPRCSRTTCPGAATGSPAQRVVEGQRMMQAASDIYLGWTKGHQENRFLYWRQLRDMKGSAVVEAMQPPGMSLYARLCGWTLARAHARSGDPIAIAAYLGKSDKFDQAIVDFSERYADQNERDYKAFVKAVKSGRLAAQQGV